MHASWRAVETAHLIPPTLLAEYLKLSCVLLIVELVIIEVSAAAVFVKTALLLKLIECFLYGVGGLIRPLSHILPWY